ncbi:MAG: hypothetical protein GWP14_07120 [Actinobacteria bacterium]|nr:hypothetical protein [Actinomycetota bacterium]
MMNRTIAITILLTAMLIGCTEQRRPRWQAIAVEQASFDDIWTVCLASLKDRGLSVDRQDRRFGLIVSEPVVGKQFFEFWRGDTASSDDLLTSSLHTVRRIVSIHVVSQGPLQFEVRVEAQAQRVSIPSDQLDSTAEAFEMIRAHGVPAAPSRRDYARPQAEPIWVDIGREHALEQYILEDIARRLRKS